MKKSAPWLRAFGRTVRSLKDAENLVSALGFCTWAPVPGMSFPNLAEAMGETAWSVMGRTWYWKDDVHVKRRLYYAKVIAGQPTFIDPDYLPDFVAGLAGGGHDEERDPGRLYQEGRLSRATLRLHETLAERGPLSTGALRRFGVLTERGLLELQRRFLICKVDVASHRRGSYAYIWDLSERFWSDAFDEARRTTLGVARTRIRNRLRQFGVEPHSALESRLFLWTPLSI